MLNTVARTADQNPTSDFLMIFPEDEIRHTEMSAGEAFKFIISGGIAKK